MTQPTEQPVLFYNGAYVYTAGPLDAYAWPGGYPIAYYPVDEHGSTTGDVLCAACANAELDDPDGLQPAECAGYIGECAANHDYEHNVTCDNCYAVIMYQTYCYLCREPVDCDDEHPIHVCPNDPASHSDQDIDHHYASDMTPEQVAADHAEWEANPEIMAEMLADLELAQVVTPAGIQYLLPGESPPPAKKGADTYQQRCF